MKITQVDVTPITMPKEDKEWRFALAATAPARGPIRRHQILHASKRMENPRSLEYAVTA